MSLRFWKNWGFCEAGSDRLVQWAVVESRGAVPTYRDLLVQDVWARGVIP